MTDRLDEFAWPVERLGQAVEVLAHRSGLSQHATQVPTVPSSALLDDDTTGDWIKAASNWLGIEAHAVSCCYEAVDQFLQASPALWRLPSQGSAKFLVVLHGSRNRLSLLTPSFHVVWVSPESFRKAMVCEMEAQLEPEIEQLVGEAGITGRQSERVKAGLIRQRLRSKHLGTCWQLRASPGSSFWQQARRMRLPQHLVILIAAYGVEYFLWIVSWWLVGKGALEGRFDRGWLLAWALLLLTIVPFRLLESWWQGVLSVGAGTLLKRRLLYGALRLMPDEIRHQGIGQFLGQVIESEAVESLALSGGFLVLIAVVELAASVIVLAWGAAGIIEIVLLLAWAGLMLFITSSYFAGRRDWARSRLSMTHDLIERMVGHRTRLAQLPRERWHGGEDEVLDRYLEVSARMDKSAVMMMSLVPRGWMILALLGLVPAFVLGRASTTGLAITLGGILLGYSALRRLVSGLGNIADAIISWKQIESLFQAAARPELVGPPLFAFSPSSTGDYAGTLIEARDLWFQYQDRGKPVLEACSLTIESGDRILLEGASGGGKSTLASLLAGLRPPQSGLLLLRGLDRQTLGDAGWRRRVVAAPQFHENHVLTETFAFNLLMGRGWPPRDEDLREAEAVCRELGLDDLLERMPAGLLQMVGETGWQLSHGERSRLFIARTLLQKADMIILDESFAALDPETLARSLECVLRRASTLMVIAHP